MVEIPVVIDIDKAFENAAARVPQAMKPLQDYMDENALAIKLRLDGKQKLTVKELLDDSTLSADELNRALADIEGKLLKISKAGGFDLVSGLKYSEKILLQAYGALESKIYGTADASKVMTKIYEANIDRSKKKVEELTQRIDQLTKKQNKYYKTVNGQKVPGGRAFENTKNQIAKANAELDLTKRKLNSLQVALSEISASGSSAAASLSSMKTPAQQAADEMRRGAEYVARYNANLGIANSRLGMLIKSAASLVALHSATSFVRNVREVTSEFEMQRVALGGIIQDTDRAEKLFKQIKAAALQSPFEIKDLVSFTKQLSAYRIETENLFDVTMRLADISAGLGVDMSRLVLAYGQVRAAAVLRGQELRQFTEAGIPLVELLAEKFRKLGKEGTTTADVFELISKRAVPFSMISEIFEDMTNAGGIFYKMQEKQSETLKGQWMKLKDALSIMYDEIGNTEAVHGAMETLIKDAMNLLRNWRKVASFLGIVVTTLAAYKVALINARIAANALTLREAAAVSALQLNVVGRSKLIAALFGETAATKAQLVVGNLYVRMKKREMVATNMFTRSLYRMAAAMLANPYAVAIAGVTALVAILFKLVKSANDAAFSAEEFQKSIESFSKASSHTQDVKELCDEYERLAEKANRTADEEERLKRVTKELAKQYPGAITGANEYGDAVEIDTKKVMKLTEAEEDLMRKVLERKKAEAEAELLSMQNRRNEINKMLREGGYVGAVDYGKAGFRHEFVPLTEKDMAGLATELEEIITKTSDLSAAIQDANDKLAGFKDDMVGPPPPDFFGDAWRQKISSYTTRLKDAVADTRAFEKDQIEKFESVKEAVEEAAKQYEVQTKLIEFYTAALETATGAQKDQLQSFLDDARLIQAMYGQILTDYNAWNLLESKRAGTTREDPFVTKMRDRIKFMQDFRKGYDDLRKYMASTEALEEESGIMLGRGKSLGLDIAEQKRAAEDLSAWYGDMIELTKKRMQARGAKGVTVNDLLGLQISDANKQLKDLQNLLQSLWDAKTDFDTDQLKRNLENSLKRVSDEIKRSETARNFFNNILDLTGDEKLAATMSVEVYGGIGDSFKERMQKQLNEALESVAEEAKTDELVKAVADQDFKTILANLDRFPEKWQEQLKKMSEDSQKFSADQIQTWLKELSEFNTYGEKRVRLAQQTAQKIAEINASGLPQAQKTRLIDGYRRKEAEETAKLQYEAFKDSPMYVDMFEKLDAASMRMLTNMRDRLIGLKEQWKNLSPTDLKEMERRIQEINRQLATKNPFKAMADGLRDYIALQRQMPRAQADQNAVDALSRQVEEEKKLESAIKAVERAQKAYDMVRGAKGEDSLEARSAKAVLDAKIKQRDAQQQIADEAKEEADAAQNSANAYQRIAQNIQDAAEGMKEWARYTSDALGGIGEIVSTFASDDFADTFNLLSQGVTRSLGGAAKIGVGLAKGIAGIPDIISGISDIVVGIGLAIQGINLKKINEQMKRNEELIESLEKSYERLEKAMAESFGSDYIYNYTKQLENLAAKQAAYEEQARLEREKGKKADEDKIKEYQQSAEDAASDIVEMRGKLAEFFTGTDVASAAKDFANSWIEAYKEFGSTTSAMKEKFQDMIQSMVEQSLGAKIVQTILQPLFDSIDEMAASGGELSAQEIAQIAQSAPEYIDQINNAMTNLMNQLAAAGYNVRQGVGQFTGISRDIAGASEESINGLAAGINTQNFYMSQINQNVAAILASMTGGTDAAGVTRGAAAASEDPYKNQMLQFAGMLPEMHDDMHEVRRLLALVVRPTGTTSTHYVATRS